MAHYNKVLEIEDWRLKIGDAAGRANSVQQNRPHNGKSCCFKKICDLKMTNYATYKKNMRLQNDKLCYLQKKNAACGRKYATKTKIRLFMLAYFLKKTLSVNYAFFMPAQLPKGYSHLPSLISSKI